MKSDVPVSQIFLKLKEGVKITDYPIYITGSERFFKLSSKYTLYDDAKANKLMKKYPEFYTFWKNVRFPIMRVDILRFIILYHYGGMVADMDVMATTNDLRKQIEGYEKGQVFIWSPELKSRYFNYEVIYSEPHNEVFLDFLRFVKTVVAEKNKMKVYDDRKVRYILFTTGPQSFNKFMKTIDDPSFIKIFPMNKMNTKADYENTKANIKKYPFITLQTTSWLDQMGIVDKHTEKEGHREDIFKEFFK